MDLFLPSIGSKFQTLQSHNLDKNDNDIKKDEISLPYSNLLEDWLKALPPTPCQSLPPVFRDLIKNEKKNTQRYLRRKEKNDENKAGTKSSLFAKKRKNLPTIREQSRQTRLSHINDSLITTCMSPKKSVRDDKCTSSKIEDASRFRDTYFPDDASTSGSSLPEYLFSEQIFKTKPSLADGRRTDLLKIRQQSTLKTTLCSSVDFESLKDNTLYVSSEEVNVFAKCQNWLDNYTS
ncbi:unnamed protein product [Dimorphilus gyrociliatus]|uniref:Uncharacterized protein n=1 Tax=Dimorphilus gyrociliatus TaxID=2664684 RepID=A0A7I8V602_9ANNE|nr:unnamed protein product [Dimorphilus gyrociliatus]